VKATRDYELHHPKGGHAFEILDLDFDPTTGDLLTVFALVDDDGESGPPIAVEGSAFFQPAEPDVGIFEAGWDVCIAVRVPLAVEDIVNRDFRKR
jgi:hypothetical protein